MACKIGFFLPFHVILVIEFLVFIEVVKGEGCIESERTSLLALKADMYDHDDWLSSWRGRDCCSWRGVGCDDATSHVISLDLRYPYQQPSGPSTVNPSLLRLTHLKYLDLSMNNFSGAPIPEFIGSLAELEHLDLSQTLFSGTVPRWLGNLSSLYSLNLSYGIFLRVDDLNWLSGNPSLRYLDMTLVNLSEASDSWIHRINMLPLLLDLRLSKTGLNHIPTTLQRVNFSSLVVLDLSSNNFHSAIPNWIFNITSLEFLNLGGCGFYQELPLPTRFFSNMRTLMLLNNQFGGGMLESLGNLSQLIYLDFSSNALNGSIPESLGMLGRLEYLDLSNNIIEGNIPKTVGNLSYLKYLHLSYNRIEGEIPQTFENLNMLEYLYLSNNTISGPLTGSIWNLYSLVELDLSFTRFSGRLPTTIGNLVNLQKLWIIETLIDGEIPEFIGNLSHLQKLDLTGNNISGKIPETIGNLYALISLELSQNRINGSIPQSIGKLMNLESLRIGGNNIDGEIPDAMGKLCKLYHLDLTDNKIKGTITGLLEGLSRCVKNEKIGMEQSDLQYLILKGNNLSGTIPPSLGQLSRLSYLDLSSNSFEGALTEVHFANLTKLDVLDLSYNHIEMIQSPDWVPPFKASDIAMCSCRLGPRFPTWLGTQTKLRKLWISDTGISDNFPLWSLTYNLSYLNMSHNMMTGPLPSLEKYKFNILDLSSNNFVGSIPSINSSRLHVINLSNNSLSGPIPQSLSLGKVMYALILSRNRINGTLPCFFCKMVSLQVLDLSNNELHGMLPLCKNETLQLVILDLSNNLLSGKITDTIGSFTHLRSLHLRNNSLCGNLPLSLKQCAKLIILDLGENRLSGSIPTWLGQNLSSLKVLRLRSNQLSGNVPIDLSNLTSLQVLDLAHNNFVGGLSLSFNNLGAMIARQSVNKPLVSYDVPRSYYTESVFLTSKGIVVRYTSVLSVVTSIDLSGNSLFGEIPNELTRLLGLIFLNLSKNYFVGNIPKDIGSMEQLESLDLSTNSLSGTIPSSMSRLYFLSHLNLSNNNLSGRIPMGDQLQTFDDLSYNGNHELCGWPLPRCHGDEPFHRRKQDGYGDGYETVWPKFSTLLGFAVGLWTFVGTIMIRRPIRYAYFRFVDNFLKLGVSFTKLKFRDSKKEPRQCYSI